MLFVKVKCTRVRAVREGLGEKTAFEDTMYAVLGSEHKTKFQDQTDALLWEAELAADLSRAEIPKWLIVEDFGIIEDAESATAYVQFFGSTDELIQQAKVSLLLTC